MNSKEKAILAVAMVSVLLTSAITVVTVSPVKQATAQILPPGSQGGNMTAPGGNMTAPGGNATTPSGNESSVKALALAAAIIKEKIKTRLDQAIQSAMQEAGPGAALVAAKLALDGDDVVYKVITIRDGRLHIIKVDPGDGRMLGTKDLSLRDLKQMLSSRHAGGQGIDLDDIDTMHMMADHPLVRGAMHSMMR